MEHLERKLCHLHVKENANVKLGTIDNLGTLTSEQKKRFDILNNIILLQ